MYRFTLPIQDTQGLVLLALTRRVLLSQAEAVKKQRSGKILKASPISKPEDPPNHAWFQLADAGFTKEDLQKVQAGLVEARRSLTVEGIPRFIERPDSRSLIYYGYEIFRYEKKSGVIRTAGDFSRVYVGAKEVQDLRARIARSWLQEAITQDLGLPAQDIRVVNCQHELSNYRINRKGIEVKSLTKAAPQALALTYGIGSFLSHRLFSKESFTARAALFTKILRQQMLCQDVVRIAGKASQSGAKFTLEEYNQVVFFKPLYLQLEKETPQLLPLLHLFLRSSERAIAYAGQHGAVLSSSYEVDSVRFDDPGCNKSGLAAVLAEVKEEFFGLRRAAMTRNVLSKTEWKALLNCGPSTMKSLCRSAENSCGGHSNPFCFDDEKTRPKTTAANDCNLAESEATDEAHSFRLPGAIEEVFTSFTRARRLGLYVEKNRYLGGQLSMLTTSSLPARLREFLPQLEATKQRFIAHLNTRFATKSAMQGYLKTEGAAQPLGQVVDWLKAEGFAQGFPAVKSTWASLLEHSAEWHKQAVIRAELERREMAAKRDVQLRALHEKHANKNGAGWTPWFEAQELAGVKVRPLHSAQMLAQEGVDQHHCVYSYHEDCWAGRTLLFSLALKGKPKVRSTLELRLMRPKTPIGGLPKEPKWFEVQHRAACNEDPDKRLEPALLLVTKLVNKAYQEAAEQELKLAA